MLDKTRRVLDEMLHDPMLGPVDNHADQLQAYHQYRASEVVAVSERNRTLGTRIMHLAKTILKLV